MNFGIACGRINVGALLVDVSMCWVLLVDISINVWALQIDVSMYGCCKLVYQCSGVAYGRINEWALQIGVQCMGVANWCINVGALQIGVSM